MAKKKVTKKATSKKTTKKVVRKTRMVKPKEDHESDKPPKKKPVMVSMTIRQAKILQTALAQKGRRLRFLERKMSKLEG